MTRNNFFLMLPLLIAIFIDALSGTMLTPLLPTLFVNSPESILSPDISSTTRYFLFGFTQAIAFVAMFFACPILGDLSDRVGRKRILILCLFGAFISYLLTVLAVIIHSVSLLLLGRLITGFTAGSISAAKAAIIDMSSEGNRTVNIGYVLLAFSLGSILGPLISGILSNSNLISWFYLIVPLYFAAFLSFLNMIYLYFSFKESHIPTTTKQLHVFSGLTSFIMAFKIPSIRRLTISFLFMQLGWATYIQFVALFLTLRYQFSTNEIGVFMACIGVGFTLAYCYLLNIITSYFSLKKIAVFSIGLIVIFIFALIMINNQLSAWILSIPSATSLAISYTVLISLFSEAVEKDQQGWVMGLTGAVSAFAFGITGLVAGVLVDFGATAPIWLSFIFLLISTISIFLLNKSSRKYEEHCA